MSSVNRRLENVYQNALYVPMNKDSKIILMSDCHRGQGDHADNFLQNQNLYFSALQHYLDEGFTYIELGDGDELWENRRMEPIVNTHSDVFWLLSEFFKKNRLHFIYGNHDMVKHRRNFMTQNCEKYYCDSKRCHLPLFPDVSVNEGIVLKDEDDGTEIFLVHGHQGDVHNDTLWMLTRFLVRYLWRPLELVGFNDPTGAGRAHKKKDKIEKRLAAYAEKNQRIMVAGHTHRPYFPEPGEGFYFNDGSVVHPRCVTGIEIENGSFSMVKWSICTKQDGTLFVCREVLEGPASIAAY